MFIKYFSCTLELIECIVSVKLMQVINLKIAVYDPLAVVLNLQ
jgi:hypothetical protein